MMFIHGILFIRNRAHFSSLQLEVQILIKEEKRYQRQVNQLTDFTCEIKSACCEYKRKLPINCKEMKTHTHTPKMKLGK